MKEDRYLIKEAASMVGVEAHVLRYWEDELKMDIHRNEMGHRYYRMKDIEAFQRVKELKDRGLQLKAIRNYLEMRKRQLEENSLVVTEPKELSDEDKMEQFQQMMNRVVATAIAENNDLIGKCAGEYAADAVVTHIEGMTKEQEARAEERYRKLDQTLREIQQARLEAAATTVRPVDKRRQARLKRNLNKKTEN